MKATHRYPFAMPAAVFRTLLLRLAMLLIFGASAGLSWWSISRLPPLTQRLAQQDARAAATENEILQLELRWDPAEAKATEGRFQQANGQLFSGPDEFTRWQAELQRTHADRFRMVISTQAGRTQASPLPNKVFSATTASIELQAAGDAATLLSPYKGLVELAQSLTTQPKRVDLLEVSASGQSNSVSRAKLLVQVWWQKDVASRR